MLQRDNKNGALLNTDRKALESYKAQKRARNDLADSINSIKADLAEIKTVVNQILIEVKK